MPKGPGVCIVGAGPTGVAAAYELARAGTGAQVLERSGRVGGIARTETWEVDGVTYRCDIGGHRYFTSMPEIREIWDGLMGDDFLDRPRTSRIFYRGKFLSYPIEAKDVLAKFGPMEAARCLGSFAMARLRPRRPETSFEDWVVNRFGRRLFSMFFRSYTEKVWGMSCQELSADWAAQRIRSMSILTVVRQALLGSSKARSLVTHFNYPRYGVGQVWEKMLDEARARGCEVTMHAAVDRVAWREGEVTGLSGEVDGERRDFGADQYISTMPLRELVLCMDPQPPAEVVEAAKALRYRSLVEVALIIEQADPFPDQWIYVHSPDVRLGRVQNYRNWSPDLVPAEGRTVLGMEYFAWVGDDLWRMADEELVALAAEEGARMGLIAREKVRAGKVFRVATAYPVYDPGYGERVAAIRKFLAGLRNLQTAGRAGLHRYNNMDHSMLTGLLAARNLLGEHHDLWRVNEEGEYLEG